MIKLKPITDTSWLVMTDNSEKVGLLNEQPDKSYLFLSASVKEVFKDRNDVNSFFNEDIFTSVTLLPSSEKKEYFVKGFPIKMGVPYNVDENNTLPVYSRSKGDGSFYCAGYYCIKFAHWVPSFCPKLETLNKYEYKGPFKTKEEMRAVLSQVKRK